MLKSSVTNKDDSEDHIYYTATFINPLNNSIAVPAVISETRSQPLVKNPDEYNVAVAVMTVSSTNVPLFFQAGAISPYKITITYTSGGTSTSYSSNISWWGSNNSQPIFGYRDICQCVNTALASVIAQINTAQSTMYNAPVLTFLPASSSFAVLFNIADATAWTSSFPNCTLRLYFNWFLYYRILNFWSFTNGYNRPDGLDVRILVQNFISNVVTYNSVQYIQMDQEIGKNNLSPVESLSLTTNSLPITQDQISVNYGLSTGSIGTGGLSIGSPILTNFYPVLSSYDTPQSTIAFEYVPSIYRLIPMISNAPLYSINITLNIVIDDGESIPYTLAPGDSFNLKLVFIRKGLTD